MSAGAGLSGPFRVERWGLIEYAEAVARMDSLAARVAAGEEENRLLLLEHPPVITFGVRGDRERDLLVSAEELARQGIALADAPRGGQATLHSPGQLVVWVAWRPIGGRRGLPGLLGALETLLIDTLADFGVAAEARQREVGLWLPGTRRKIASFGLCFRGGAATHGAALNVVNDLALFRLLTPCGLTDATIARLADEMPSGSELGAPDLSPTSLRARPEPRRRASRRLMGKGSLRSDLRVRG
jgi:lipoyl(octanoyl) transferase